MKKQFLLVLTLVTCLPHICDAMEQDISNHDNANNNNNIPTQTNKELTQRELAIKSIRDNILKEMICPINSFPLSRIKELVNLADSPRTRIELGKKGQDVRAIQLVPNTNEVLIINAGQRVTKIDLSTNQETEVISLSLDNTIKNATVSSNCKFMMYQLEWGNPTEISLFNLETNQKVATLQSGNNFEVKINDQLIAVPNISSANIIDIYNCKGQQVKSLQTNGTCDAVELSMNNKYIIAHSEQSSTLSVYDLDTQKWSKPLDGKYANSFAFLSDDTTLCIADVEGKICLLNIVTGEKKGIMNKPPYCTNAYLSAHSYNNDNCVIVQEARQFTIIKNILTKPDIKKVQTWPSLPHIKPLVTRDGKFLIQLDEIGDLVMVVRNCHHYLNNINLKAHVEKLPYGVQRFLRKVETHLAQKRFEPYQLFKNFYNKKTQQWQESTEYKRFICCGEILGKLLLKEGMVDIFNNTHYSHDKDE